MLVVTAVIAAPWILRAAVPEAFARFGMQASVTGGSLSVLRREVTLEGFILGAPDAPALSVGELGVGLRLRALIEGRIKLRHVRVKDVSVDAPRLLALQAPGDTGSVSRPRSLPVELDQLELEDIRLVSLAERIGHDVRIGRLEVSDLSALLAGGNSNVDLQGSIGDGSVNLQLEIGLDGGKLRATGEYRVDEIPLRGWAALGIPEDDPLSQGVASGRGDIRTSYAFDATSLDIILDGRVSVAGLGVNIGSLQAERGDASWQGRLAIQWSPGMAAPNLRGDGSLEVETLRVAIARSSQSPAHAVVSDVSWQGDFDWRDGFTSEGAVLGTSVEVTGASSGASVWRAGAEDFSWRLQARVEGDSDEFGDKFGVRIQDFDVARFSVTVAGGGAPVAIAAEKLAVDEMRTAQSGDLVLGLASVDTLTVTESGGAKSADGATYRADGLTARGLSGDFSGKLQVAYVSAESLDYADSERRLRADGIDLASVGFSAPAWVGAEELNLKSMRADEAEGDIWLSGLKATKVYADAGGSFGADVVDVTQIFQSGSSDFSWQASGLKLGGVRGDVEDATRVSAIDLGELKIGIDDTSWESSGLHTADLVVTMNGSLNVARLGLAKLERRQPSVGDLRITELDARGLGAGDARATLDDVKVARLEYGLPDGNEFDARGLEARELRGDLLNGLRAGRLSVARGAARNVSGALSSAAALDARGLSVATDGRVAVERAQLQSFSRSDSDSTILDLDGLGVAALSWAPGGRLSAANAAIRAARLARADGASWTLADLDTGNLDWDGELRIGADRATLASVSQLRGESRDWRVQALRAADLRFVLPAQVEVASLTIQSVDGGAGPPTWKVASVTVKGLNSSEDQGQTIDSLGSGALTVADERNGALLSLRRAEIEALRVSTLDELSARRLLVDGLRLASDKPGWPSRLTVAQLRVGEPLLRLDGAVELGDVVARNPYLIVAQTKDNTWMWPPLPGAGDGKGDEKGSSGGGVRVATFSTRGPGRIVYIDRATEPVFREVLDPIVVAVQNLDTTLPGNVSRFRARGTSTRYAGVTVRGKLLKRVEGFDLRLKVSVKAADLPALNPYARRGDFAITAGRGDADVDLGIEDGALSGQVQLLLSGLEARSAAGGNTSGRIDPAALPVRTALALLRDRRGNISLTIPLQEQTDDPRYDFIDSFQRNFARTVTAAGRVAANLPGKTLDTALRLLESTVSLLPGVSAERYSPIAFADAADEFTAQPLVYLDQLGKRMRRYESLELALCGRSVARDGEAAIQPSSSLDKLFAEASRGIYRNYEPGQEGLLALAEARADIVRRFLRDAQRIPERRLLSCDARIDTAPDAEPRVDLEVKTPAERRGLFGLFP
ncbi:MAG: hypothetical protein BMS9Abin01_0265 [Gammaproteobacteria bacterium]|nr:MAG: hypothetical protein BMS9Abin01_0265 [Gammaproteobacteria bacterium]